MTNSRDPVDLAEQTEDRRRQLLLTQYEKYKASSEYLNHLDVVKRSLLEDDSTLCEAIGPDGSDFSAAYWCDEIRQLLDRPLAGDSKAASRALGQFLYRQIQNYLTTLAEKIINQGGPLSFKENKSLQPVCHCGRTMTAASELTWVCECGEVRWTPLGSIRIFGLRQNTDRSYQIVQTEKANITTKSIQICLEELQNFLSPQDPPQEDRPRS